MNRKVISFELVDTHGYPGWWLLTVEAAAEERPFLVANNWVNLDGAQALKPGDEVVFEKAKVPVYSDCEYDFVQGLRRVPKEAEGVI